MGERFYLQQGLTITKVREAKMEVPKVKKRLKADIIKDIETVLETELPGLAKCDVKTLEALMQALEK